MRVVVHGDDFTVLGDKLDLNWLAHSMKQKFELKVKAMLGSDKEDDKTVRILNRIVEWTSDCIEYE